MGNNMQVVAYKRLSSVTQGPLAVEEYGSAEEVCTQLGSN